MATRIVLIHPGPSATCPCDVCRDDGSDATPRMDGTCCDDYGQGRNRASYEGSLRAVALACVGLVVVVIAAVVYAAVRS